MADPAPIGRVRSEGDGRRSRASVASRGTRVAWLAAVAAGVGLCETMLWPPDPILLWNASPSSAVGLYLLTSPAAIGPGEIAVAWPPDAAARLAEARRYLPSGVPLVKHVAAASRDRVCGSGARIVVNGRTVAVRRARDRSGRPMAWWSGCRVLRPGELLLLSPNVPDAFDGRYFGISRKAQLIGRGRLLWGR